MKQGQVRRRRRRSGKAFWQRQRKDHMAAAKADLVDAIQEAEKSKGLTKASKDSEAVCQKVVEHEKIV